ncbi:MAG: hypothetical protein VX380_04490 [Verrucomicrobiota bacterium]
MEIPAKVLEKDLPIVPAGLAKELAEQGGSEEAQLDCYRKVRDEIKENILTLPESLEKK